MKRTAVIVILSLLAAFDFLPARPQPPAVKRLNF